MKQRTIFLFKIVKKKTDYHTVDGWVVGEVVGLVVGWVEGCVLGWVVGLVLGCVVGAVDGAVVGAGVGNVVGSLSERKSIIFNNVGVKLR